MQTYWLHPKKDEAEKSEGSSDNDDAALWLESEPRLPELETDPLRLSLSEQNQRLAGWNANQLLKLLNRLMLQRNAKLGPDGKAIDDQIFIENAHQRWAGEGMAIIDEVKDCIEMPVFDLDTFPTDMDAEIKLPEPVIQQLHGTFRMGRVQNNFCR